MSADDPDRPPNDAEDIIARAKRELAERMFARMQEDDEQDERDGVELSDSSAAGSPLDSDSEWDLPGRSSSGRGGSGRPGSGRGSSGFEDLSSSIESLDGATLTEGSDQPHATLDFSSSALYATLESEPPAAEDRPAVPRYRPERRPAMGVLVVFDDGGATGERLRVRKTPFDVGRVDGDLVIAHDQQMSRRHFRIDRRHAPDNPDSTAWEWSVRDLDSLNGTFVCHRKIRIANGDEILLGNEVIRIKQPKGTGQLVLTKLGAGDNLERVTVEPGTRLLGADRAVCLPLLTQCPLLAPRHLQLHCDRSMRWTATALDGTDGVWVRKAEFPLVDSTQWQSGEQRFAFFLR